MYEWIPIGLGFALGACLSRLRRGPLLASLLAIGSLLVGLLASGLSGELSESVGFLAFDTAQALVAAVMGLALARAASSRRRPRGDE